MFVEGLFEHGQGGGIPYSLGDFIPHGNARIGNAGVGEVSSCFWGDESFSVLRQMRLLFNEAFAQI